MSVEVRSRAPDFTFRDENGEDVSLSARDRQGRERRVNQVNSPGEGRNQEEAIEALAACPV
jgi:hypothetical protein